MFYRPLIALILLWVFILALTVAVVSLPNKKSSLIYLGDYNDMSGYYVVLDAETGATHRFERPRNFKPIQYYGEGPYPARLDITSPYDETVQFVVLREGNVQNREDTEQLYRVREDDQLEHILSGEYIYFSGTEFAENGRFLYIFKKSGNSLYNVFYTLYRYDTQTTELSDIAHAASDGRLNCQAGWCQLTTGNPDNQSTTQTLLVLHKNSGELREVVTADSITHNFWWGFNEVLYTPYHNDGHALISIYSILSDQSRIISDIEGRGITNITREYWSPVPEKVPSDNWLLVTTNSPDNDRLFDLYIVNDFDDNPNTYPLDIQSSNGTWFPHEIASDGSLLLITFAPEDDNTNNVYIVNDPIAHPTVDRLTSADFDTPDLVDVRAENAFGDSFLMRVRVSDSEWRYYSLHIPTRTITQLASFYRNQWVVQAIVSEDNRWLAMSIEESGEYYITVVPIDGSQQPRRWDVETESYVCLLGWYKPHTPPSACTLYFGIG